MAEEHIFFNKMEAMRYFRAQSGDVNAEALVAAAYQKLKSELQPRYTVKRFGCRALSEKELLQVSSKPASGMDPENEAEDVISLVLLDNGTVFHSKALAKYVGESKELFLFGATLGSRVDVALRRMVLTSVAEAGAGQAVAAALIETYCDDCCAELQRQLPDGKRLKRRFSPGYGDWSLEEQKLLFPALDCARTIGLTLTESCMMAPVKSVTAVMAVAETAEKNESAADNKKEKNIFQNYHCNQKEKSVSADYATEDNRNQNKKETESRKSFSNTNNKCLHCSKTDCEFRQK